MEEGTASGSADVPFPYAPMVRGVFLCAAGFADRLECLMSVMAPFSPKYMHEAIDLAARGRGHTSPNPRVGAVLVKNNMVIGRGYHETYGGPHAEVNALAEAGETARGADLYVTLEPCCVWGKTPPCTEAIIGAGVRRVIVPLMDPNPDVSGRGIAILRDAGVVVEVGCLETEAADLNAPYMYFRRTGLPHVTLKLAVTVDGRITMSDPAERWISGEASRDRVHAMRSDADAILVGVGTLLADDPQLTDRRRDGGSRQPARIIADSLLRTPSDAAVIRGADAARTIIAAVADAGISDEA
ncbi:bifunctional diaminohydroxyphosphoribosylaminopyrimidine deaminase/5-amino-6-(5-phosphoribosylamino)uracil reductase RibD, partial [bacterium]|nr:bifunctional diaminohydroxyphosphoribosylaminopyrimidine deaminase/5-amino-6-(5-phosphoribosylamino)uracil reductase RibD [bacterium]